MAELSLVSLKLTISPIAPFDFDLTTGIFSHGDDDIATYKDGKYSRVIRVDDKLILVEMKSTGTVEKPKLLVELKSDKRITDAEKRQTRKIIKSMFNLDLNLERFYAATNKDKTLARIANQLRGLKTPSTETVFEALISSIIEQQISLNVARHMEHNIVRAFGDVLRTDDRTFWAFPTPRRLASATIKRLRKLGLSQRKAEYIQSISRLVADGELDLEKLGAEDVDEIIRQLDQIRGIGLWTAELTMLRGMHKFEVMPADDLGLRRVIAHYYCHDQKISSEEAREIGEKWEKWKGLASFYLIVADLME